MTIKLKCKMQIRHRIQMMIIMVQLIMFNQHMVSVFFKKIKNFKFKLFSSQPKK